MSEENQTQMPEPTPPPQTSDVINLDYPTENIETS